MNLTTKLTDDEIATIRDLAQSQWWASSIDLFSSVGLNQDDIPAPVSTLAQAIPLNDAYRRRIEDPAPLLASISEYADLLRRFSTESGLDVVTKRQFLDWLESQGKPQFPFTQQWRTIVAISGVKRPPREQPVMSFRDLVDVVDRFHSEERAIKYTLKDFKEWCIQWHGSDLTQTARLVIGGGSWLTTKGVVFGLHSNWRDA